jgi:hypothetical protein
MAMASQKSQNDDVKTNRIHDVVIENYSKISDEFAKSQQQHLQAISGLQQEYLESVKITVKTTISIQKEYLSNSNLNYPALDRSTTQVDNMINQSNEYTTNIIRWVNLQNDLMVKNAEVLKTYMKSYNSALVTMAEYYFNMIKARNSFGSKTQ